MHNPPDKRKALKICIFTPFVVNVWMNWANLNWSILMVKLFFLGCTILRVTTVLSAKYLVIFVIFWHCHHQQNLAILLKGQSNYKRQGPQRHVLSSVATRSSTSSYFKNTVPKMALKLLEFHNKNTKLFGR